MRDRQQSGDPKNIVNVVPGLIGLRELHGYHLAKYEYVAGMFRCYE